MNSEHADIYILFRLTSSYLQNGQTLFLQLVNWANVRASFFDVLALRKLH